MKNHLTRLFALAVACFFSPGEALHAQGGPGGPNSGMNPAMLKMFGDVKAFSAKAEMRVSQADKKEMMSGTIDFAMLENKTRMEMDLTQMKSAQIRPDFVAQLKQMGMDINIARLDKNIFCFSRNVQQRKRRIGRLVTANHGGQAAITQPL